MRENGEENPTKLQAQQNDDNNNNDNENNLKGPTEITPEHFPIQDFDDILWHVGSWGRFQILLTCFFFPFNLFLGYVYLASILTNFTPPHNCQIPELMNLSREARLRLAVPVESVDANNISIYSSCSVYATNWTEVLEAGIIEADESWTLLDDCPQGWEFDTESYHRTVVTDFQWVCGSAWIPALSQAIFFLGAIPGTLLFGWLSDHYGRVPTTVASNLIAMIAGVAMPFINGYQAFFFLRFMMGFAYNTFWSQPYILTLEYVDERKRTFVGNFGIAIFLSISGVYQPWLIKALGDWKIFNWILFGQMGLVFFVPWIMPESGRWLMSMGKTEETIKILKDIARINGKEVKDEVYESFRELCSKQKDSSTGERSQASFLDLFRDASMRRITIMIIILWMFTSLIFDASVRNVENLEFSLYISFMISTGLEFPADLLVIPGLEMLGRRWSALLSLFLSGLFMLVTIPCLDGVSTVGVGVLSMLGRFCATYAMNTGLQFTIEVMPTELRGQGNALASVMAMVAQLASPYVVYSKTLSPTAPFWILGILGIVGGIPALFLPETAGINLPETVADVENFGRNDNFFWMPVMGKSNRQRKQQESA